MAFLVSPILFGEYTLKVFGFYTEYEPKFHGYASAEGVATLMAEGEVLSQNELSVSVRWNGMEVDADLLPEDEAIALRRHLAEQEWATEQVSSMLPPVPPPAPIRMKRPTGK